MISELIGAAQSVQSLSSLLIAANKLSNYNEIVSAISEINSKLMHANSFALLSQEKIAYQQTRIAILENQIKSLNDWDSEAKGYEDIQVASGIFVVAPLERAYKLKSTMKLCTNCFYQKHKSVLQHSDEAMRKCGLTCHRCNSKLIFNHYIDSD